MKCANCGAELEPGVSFCRECGSKVKTVKKLFCRDCGAELSEGSKFCSKCGAKVLDLDAFDVEDSKGDTAVNPEGPEVVNTPISSNNSASDSTANNTSSIHDTAAPKKQTIGIKLKAKIADIWNRMCVFSKIATIGAILIGILTVVAICTGKALPIVISVLQIAAIVIAILAHHGKITFRAKWLKYLILVVAILLSVANIASYSVGENSTKQPSTNNSTATQPESKVCTPFNAADCVGKSKDEIIRSLKAAGFENINEQVISDLLLDEAEKEGYVESVTINSISDFAANQEFLEKANVVISYHSFRTIPAPIDSFAAESTDVDELITLFQTAGFVDLQIDETFDLDPDKTDLEFKNVVKINGESSFDTITEFPMNSRIQINTHRPFEKYTLKVVVDFMSNLFFSTYDVKFEVNGETTTLKHGEDGTFEYRLKPGKYTLSFKNAESSSVKGTAEIDLNGDTEVSYQINCHSDEITVKELYIENKGAVGDDEAMVPASASTCRYDNYNDVVKWFSDAGFTNISTEIQYDIVFGWTSEGEVAKVSIDGNEDFKRGDIFKKNAPVVVTYHMKEDDDPARATEATEEATKPKTYAVDKDMVVTKCERDTKYTTMYHVAFAEVDSSGNHIREYAFGHCINPRAMGKEFNAIGDLPNWFYVGATVHVKANFGNDGLSETDTFVTEATGTGNIGAIDSTESMHTVVLPEPSSKLGKDFDSQSSSTVYYINVDGVKNKPTIKIWNGATVTDGVAEYLETLKTRGFNVQITSQDSKTPYEGFTYYETYFEVSNEELSWTMYLNIQSEDYIEYELDINLD